MFVCWVIHTPVEGENENKNIIFQKIEKILLPKLLFSVLEITQNIFNKIQILTLTKIRIQNIQLGRSGSAAGLGWVRSKFSLPKCSRPNEKKTTFFSTHAIGVFSTESKLSLVMVVGCRVFLQICRYVPKSSCCSSEEFYISVVKFVKRRFFFFFVFFFVFFVLISFFFLCVCV